MFVSFSKNEADISKQHVSNSLHLAPFFFTYFIVLTPARNNSMIIESMSDIIFTNIECS